MFVDHPHNAFAVHLNPQAYKRIDIAEINRPIQRQILVILKRANVDGRIKIAKDGVFHIRAQAEHFGLKTHAAAAPHHCNAVVNPQESIGPAGLSPAIVIQRAAAAAAVGRAFFDDLPQAPFVDGDMRIGRLGNDLLHQAEGLVHCAEALHGAEDGAAAFGAKFGGVENLFLKEFDLVAAEFLDVQAADGPLGLGEHPHLGAVLKAAFFLMHSSVDPVFKMFGDKSGEVFIHSTRLIERAGDDADAAIVLKQTVQERGDCGQLSFASAAVGPDDAVAADLTGRAQRRLICPPGVPQIFHRAVVARADLPIGYADAQMIEDELFELIGRLGTCDRGYFRLGHFLRAGLLRRIGFAAHDCSPSAAVDNLCCYWIKKTPSEVFLIGCPKCPFFFALCVLLVFSEAHYTFLCSIVKKNYAVDMNLCKDDSV